MGSSPGVAGGERLGRRGFSKDHRPDLSQMILAVLLDGDSRPVRTEMWPGNTADVTSLIPAINRLQRRFRINRVCVVADRGMISAETIAELEARKLLYVLGVRERTDKLVRELVLDDPAPFVPFVLTKPRREVDYEAKAVTLAGRRYVVCRNLDEMKKDAANRATIVAALERQLKKGDKSLVGNKGYRRFLKDPEGEGFAIDRARVEEDAKFDGVFVLQTNANLSALEAMLVYKQRWTVERTFRTTKSLLETRPTPGLVWGSDCQGVHSGSVQIEHGSWFHGCATPEPRAAVNPRVSDREAAARVSEAGLTASTAQALAAVGPRTCRRRGRSRSVEVFQSTSGETCGCARPFQGGSPLLKAACGLASSYPAALVRASARP